MTLRWACLGAALVVTLPGCGPDGRCGRQCAVLADCGILPDVEPCTTACEGMLDGVCESPGCTGTGGSPRACVEALLENNADADGRLCAPEFVTSWCDTYFEDPACSPFSLGEVTCR